MSKTPTNTIMEKEILNQVNKAIGEAIVNELCGYNKPLSKLTARVIEANEEKLFGLINTEMQSMLNSEDFEAQLRIALNAKLAKTLISRMGGELEKRVNELKADPTTRAKVTVAIDRILSENVQNPSAPL